MILRPETAAIRRQRLRAPRRRRDARAGAQPRDDDEGRVPAVGQRALQALFREVVRDRVVDAGRHPQLRRYSRIDPPNPFGATPTTV